MKPIKYVRLKRELDRWLETCLKLPPQQRLVTVKAECVRDMLSIVLENNCVPDGTDTDRTSRGDDFLHGFGIRNIKKAVEKYAGQCLIRQEKGCFRCPNDLEDSAGTAGTQPFSYVFLQSNTQRNIGNRRISGDETSNFPSGCDSAINRYCRLCR